MISNLFLVQENSSNYDYAFITMFKLIGDKIMWAVSLGTFGGLLLMLYTPLNGILNLASLAAIQMLLSVTIAAISVLWYDIIKL